MNEIKKDLLNAFAQYCENGTLPYISPIAEMLYYNILADAGLVEEIVVTEAEQRAIFERTINSYSRGGFIGEKNRLEREGLTSPQIQPGAFKLSRRKALENAFIRMKKDGIKLEQYITTK